MQLGLITNARSRRNQRLLPKLRDAVASHPGIRSVELDGVSGLDEALRSFAAREIPLVGVVGGDGTVQAVLTRLLSGDGCGFPALPLLTIFAGGTTNMTAADVGLRGRPDLALRRLAACWPREGEGLPGEALDRHVIEVRRGDDPPLYGMFFGTGAICRAMNLARRSVHPMRLGSTVESALTLAGTFGEGLLGRAGKRRDPVLRGDDIAVIRDSSPPSRGPTLLALATTLDRLVLRSRPFWGEGAGPLRCTRIAYPAPRFGRSVPAILYGYGREGLASPQYSSCNAERVRLEMDCPFTLDGELFTSSRLVPIDLSGHKRIRFVRF